MIVFEKGGSVKKEGWVGSCFLRGGRNRALTTTLHGLDFIFNDSRKQCSGDLMVMSMIVAVTPIFYHYFYFIFYFFFSFLLIFFIFLTFF